VLLLLLQSLVGLLELLYYASRLLNCQLPLLYSIVFCFHFSHQIIIQSCQLRIIDMQSPVLLFMYGSLPADHLDSLL
jgi:hypothetical protein